MDRTVTAALTEHELAQLDDLIDCGAERSGPGDDVAPDESHAGAPPEEELVAARARARRFLSAVDRVLLTLDSEHLSLEPESSFARLVDARELAVPRKKGGDSNQ
jgi:hypothetical protein